MPPPSAAFAGPPGRCFASDAVKQYVVDIVGATRQDPLLRLGASPRSSVHLLQAAKALSLLNGRDHVLPDDVQSLAVCVLAHRVLLSTEAAPRPPLGGVRHQRRRRPRPGAVDPPPCRP